MVEIALGSNLGVAMRSFSSRLSRMWAWQIETLEVIGCQDVRGRANLVDIDFSGDLASYRMERQSKGEFYIAICRPPFWHALWLKHAFHLSSSGVYFKETGWEWFGNLPFEVSSHLVERDGGKNIPQASSETLNTYQSRVWELSEGSVNMFDRMGREYSFLDGNLLVERYPLIDVSATAFKTVSTPDWAKLWPGNI